MRRFWLATRLALVMAFTALDARADDLAAKTAAFRAALEAARQEIGFPGATAAFVLPDGRVGEVAVGVADRLSDAPLPLSARMMSGSTGKTYAAAVALALSRQGKLDLDAPITRYLGEPDWLLRLPNAQRITLRQLLTHTSGLRDHVSVPAFGEALLRQAMADPDKALSPLQCIAFIDGQPALFEPGQGYAYSDTGYLIAGLVIEAASGERFYDLAERLFLKPLGLTSTTPADHRRLADLAQGYPVWPEGAPLPETILEAPGVLRWNPASEWTGGGYVTRSRDAAVWAATLYGGKAMAGDYLPDLLRGSPIAPGATKTYGLGVFVSPSPYGVMYGHSGYYPGYRSDLAYFPDLKVAVAFQIDTETGVRSGKVLDRIRESLVTALAVAPRK